MRLTTLILACLSLVPALSLAGESVTFDSGDRQNRLLELFTSEGCSSCPPADRFLSELQQKDSLWKPWVPVAFHVDYWNYLGWDDAFAKPEHATRQYAYREAKRSNGVYTPGFFINGQEWRGFFKFNRSLPDPARPPAGRLHGTFANGKASLQFQSLAASSQSQYVLHWALTGSDRSTEVRSGENARRTLHHDFVALNSGRVLQTGDNPQWQIDIPLDNQQSPLALSFWVTPVNNPYEVLQATGNWLQ